jgi:hypothetical protein
MRFNELLNEDKRLSEAIPKSKGANAFGQMATNLSKEKPNTMSNAPVSATNKAKPGNPNTPSFGKGTAMPTKPFQTPGAGTTPAPKTAAPTTTPKVDAPTSTTTPKADKPTTTPTDPVAQGAATSPDEPEKLGMMYKMGKGIGDFGRGFKIGYGGRMPTDSDVVPDEEPGSASKPGADAGASGAAQGKETSDYSRIKANVDKLDKKGKQRILGILQKELGITTKPVTPEPGANAMASMAGQLAGTKPQSTTPTPTPSSTGGQTTKTATGVRHTAKPSNVPQPASTTPMVTPATKPTRTGGRKSGQLSPTPNAVRKRTARAAARGVQNSSIQRSGNLIAEGFSIFRKK